MNCGCVITSPVGGVQCCDEHVCMWVCLSGGISQESRPNFIKFSVLLYFCCVWLWLSSSDNSAVSYVLLFYG